MHHATDSFYFGALFLLLLFINFKEQAKKCYSSIAHHKKPILKILVLFKAKTSTNITESEKGVKDLAKDICHHEPPSHYLILHS